VGVEEIEVAPAVEDLVDASDDDRRQSLGDGHDVTKLVGAEDEHLDDAEIDRIGVLEQRQMESEPFPLVQHMVSKPFLVLLLVYAPLAAFTALAVVGKFYELDAPHSRDYLIWEDPVVQNWDK